MVLVLAIPIRAIYKLENLITMRHLRNSAKVMLATGLITAYGYLMETFMAWYGANIYDSYMMRNRELGPYAPVYWTLIACNIIVPQALWSRKVRSNVPLLFIISLIILVAMWLERFVIVVTSLTRDFVPSMWGMYWPTKWDVMVFAGTIGFFVFLMLLFVRFLPMISIAEVRQLLPQAEVDVE
jgi:molybdopterin-containing oxidoreductase family membrane subunit